MPKDYITILNRLPARIHIGEMSGYLDIAIVSNDFNDRVIIIRYLNSFNDYPIIHTDSYRTFEETIDDIINKLSKYIDIHDILQP